MASDKTLICGLGGNTKTTEPMKCFIFTDMIFTMNGLAESTLEPPSGFEHGTTGLGITLH